MGQVQGAQPAPSCQLAGPRCISCPQAQGSGCPLFQAAAAADRKGYARETHSPQQPSAGEASKLITARPRPRYVRQINPQELQRGKFSCPGEAFFPKLNQSCFKRVAAATIKARPVYPRIPWILCCTRLLLNVAVRGSSFRNIIGVTHSF